jgi:hypothetical protein
MSLSQEIGYCGIPLQVLNTVACLPGQAVRIVHVMHRDSSAPRSCAAVTASAIQYGACSALRDGGYQSQQRRTRQKRARALKVQVPSCRAMNREVWREAEAQHQPVGANTKIYERMIDNV